jgi:hypothetical protein
MFNVKFAKLVLIGLALVVGFCMHGESCIGGKFTVPGGESNMRGESAGQYDKIQDLEAKAASQPANAELQTQLGMAYFYKARLGDVQAVDKATGTLEKLAVSAPGNTEAGRWLGLSYLVKIALLSRSGAGPAEIVTAAERAAAAFDRVLEHSSNDALALSAHGFALTVSAAFKRSPDLFARGIAEMNRAVSIDPSDINPRLLRGFALINFPPPFRDLKAAKEDLTAILKGVPAGYNDRAEAVLHVFLGDVYLESKEAASARGEYEAAAKMQQPAAEVARARLAALEHGQPKPDEIQRYRELANNCTACHSR